MVKKNEKVKKISLIVIMSFFIIVAIFFIGKSLALFNYAKEGKNNNIISFKGLDIKIQNSSMNALNLNNSYPISDSDGLNGTPFEFKLSNQSNENICYIIKIENDAEKQSSCQSNGSTCQAMSTNYIKYAYKKGNGEYSEPAILGQNNNILLQDGIDRNSEKTISVLLWIDSTAGNEIQGSYFFGKLILERVNVEYSSCGTAIISNNDPNNNQNNNPNNNQNTSGLLRELVLADNTAITTAPTLDTTSEEANERGLYKMSVSNSFGGGSGNTYFFRGNITNNVVEFAGMIWRIVRINENGTVRLILDVGINDNEKYRFGSNDKMYYSESSDYMKKTVEDWYEENIIGTNAEKVASGNYFCEAAKTYQYNAGTMAMTYYEEYTPRLDCTADENGKGLITASVGLITYDEAVLAGGYGVFNENYYLSKNINNENTPIMWTMSPAGIPNNGLARGWVLLPKGQLSDDYVYKQYAVRPVINLKADTTATKDTTTGHYIVN